MIFVTWLRHFFDIDESRLRVRLYLHEGLDLDAATRSGATARHPAEQFRKPYRAVADPTLGGHQACPRLPGGELQRQHASSTCDGPGRGGIVHQLPFRGSSVGRAAAC